MERLDLGAGRSILFAAINPDRSGLAQFDRHHSRRRVCPEKRGVFLEFHPIQQKPKNELRKQENGERSSD
jgi:hypothetical protein